MSLNTDYTVRLSVFEGPMDLLLHLIKINEMEINEINISEITTQYLDYLRLLEKLDLEVAGDFLVMASSLINIKLRSLLPDSEEEIETEELAGEDSDGFATARELMQRLIEYRRFKEAARKLSVCAERRELTFVRDVAFPKIIESASVHEIKGDFDLLLDVFSRVIKFVQRRDYHYVHNEQYSLEDKLAQIRRQLLLESKLTLKSLLTQCTAKIEMVLTLIALLELCRLMELRLMQDIAFDDVIITRREALEGTVSDDIASERAAVSEEIIAIERKILRKQAREAKKLEAMEAELLQSRPRIVEVELPVDDSE